MHGGVEASSTAATRAQHRNCLATNRGLNAAQTPSRLEASELRPELKGALIEQDLPLFPKDDVLANLDDVLASVAERVGELL